MNWLLASLLVAFISWLFVSLGLVSRAEAVMQRGRAVTDVLRSTELTDLDKEKQMQAEALAIFRLFFSICVRSLLAFSIPVATLYALGYLNLFDADQVLEASLNPIFLAIVVLVFIGIYLRRRRV